MNSSTAGCLLQGMIISPAAVAPVCCLLHCLTQAGRVTWQCSCVEGEAHLPPHCCSSFRREPASTAAKFVDCTSHGSTHTGLICGRCALHQPPATKVALPREGPASGWLATATTSCPRPQAFLFDSSHQRAAWSETQPLSQGLVSRGPDMRLPCRPSARTCQPLEELGVSGFEGFPHDLLELRGAAEPCPSAAICRGSDRTALSGPVWWQSGAAQQQSWHRLTSEQ